MTVVFGPRFIGTTACDIDQRFRQAATFTNVEAAIEVAVGGDANLEPQPPPGDRMWHFARYLPANDTERKNVSSVVIFTEQFKALAGWRLALIIEGITRIVL